LELKLRQSGGTVKYLEFDLLLSRKKIEKLEEDLTVERDPGLSATHNDTAALAPSHMMRLLLPLRKRSLSVPPTLEET